MDIETCLLDRDNPAAAGGISVGERLRAAGRERLWDDRKGAAVDTVVIHYMSAAGIDPQKPYDRGLLLKIFCDYGVSSHYLIDREGAALWLVPEEGRAWHAGGSIMPEPDNRTGVNAFSIGIELMATADSGFTQEQYRALAGLCAAIERRHTRPLTYVGHDQIAGERAVGLGLRKDVKVDPGKLFDWQEFFRLLEQSRIPR
jgi:N-acetyl-anhydromuramyl-L-alanine amidase AmpD